MTCTRIILYDITYGQINASLLLRLFFGRLGLILTDSRDICFRSNMPTGSVNTKKCWLSQQKMDFSNVRLPFMRQNIHVADLVLANSNNLQRYSLNFTENYLLNHLIDVLFTLFILQSSMVELVLSVRIHTLSQISICSQLHSVYLIHKCHLSLISHQKDP